MFEGPLLYFLAGTIGAAVGVGELVARYRDEPASIFRLRSAWLYVALNASAAVAALYLARAFEWKFGGTTTTQQALLQLLVAGFGAMAFLRSSLFTVKVGETDVGVGPSALLTVLLEAADRHIDRARGIARLKVARTVMKDFDLARTVTVTGYVLAAMQNITPEEVERLVSAVTDQTGKSGATDEEKAVAVGLVLLNVAGEHLLREAVAAPK